jgi:hypothetical protein
VVILTYRGRAAQTTGRLGFSRGVFWLLSQRIRRKNIETQHDCPSIANRRFSQSQIRKTWLEICGGSAPPTLLMTSSVRYAQTICRNPKTRHSVHHFLPDESLLNQNIYRTHGRIGDLGEPLYTVQMHPLVDQHFEVDIHHALSDTVASLDLQYSPSFSTATTNMTCG